MKNFILSCAWMLPAATICSTVAAAEDAANLPSVMKSNTVASASGVPAATTPTNQAAAPGIPPFVAATPAADPSAEATRWAPGPVAEQGAVPPVANAATVNPLATPPADNPSAPPTNFANPLRDTAPPTTSAAAEAPAWGQPAGNLPQALPDMGTAKPLNTPPDFGAASPAELPTATTQPPTNIGQSSPLGDDGKLLLPNPPDMGEYSREVQPAGHVELLPPPPRTSATAPGTTTRPPELGDSVTAPATSAAPPVDPAVQAAAHAAVDLLKTALPSSNEPSVNLVSLRQVLERCPASDRAAVTQKYWKWSRAVCSGNWANDELKRLNQIAPNQPATSSAGNTRTAESPMLSTARAAAAARVTEAELEIARARAALQMWLQFQTPGPMRPSDVPLVGPYHTFYQQIFASRPNVRAFEIDQLMPLRVKAINDWVVTVHSSSSAVHSAEQAHAQGTADMRTVLACHDAMREQRRKFLDAVYQYNCDIAEYASLAAPAGTTADKFVSMLIPTKSPERLSALPARPTAPINIGGQPQQHTGQTQTGDRRLPWGDGWMPRSASSPPLPLPTAPIVQSRGATGEWQNPPASIPQANNPPTSNAPLNTLPPPASTNSPSSAPPDPFGGGSLGSRYSQPPGR